jgi:hypothetical protein
MVLERFRRYNTGQKSLNKATGGDELKTHPTSMALGYQLSCFTATKFFKDFLGMCMSFMLVRFSSKTILSREFQKKKQRRYISLEPGHTVNLPLLFPSALHDPLTKCYSLPIDKL